MDNEPTKKKEDTAPEVLTMFREAVLREGYKGLTEEMVAAALEHGTPEDKVAACIHGCYDARINEGKQLLTIERVGEIMQDTFVFSPDGQERFVKGAIIYDTLNRGLLPLRSSGYYLNETMANIAGNINLCEWIWKAENLLENVAPLIDESKRKEFEKVVADYRASAESNWGCKDDEDEDKSGSELAKAQIKHKGEVARLLCADYLPHRIADYKGHLKGIKQWIEKNGAEMFVPWLLQRALREEGKEYRHSDIHWSYFKDSLAKRKELGEEITPEEKRQAIIPDASKIKPEKWIVEYINNYLDEQRRILRETKWADLTKSWE